MEMRRLPFSLRELMIFTLVVALALALWDARSRYAAARAQLDDVLASPHVWVWSPELQTKVPIGGAVGVGGHFFYSDKESFTEPITATIKMIDASSGTIRAEETDLATVGVPGRRSFAGNFNSKMYGKDLEPGPYIFLVTIFHGKKEVGRGATTVYFYRFSAPTQAAPVTLPEAATERKQ